MNLVSNTVNVIIVAASVATMAGCRNEMPALGVASSIEFIVPDRTFLNGIADRAQMLRETTEPVACTVLASQLQIASCEATRPAPTEKGPTLSPADVYGLRMHSVLVLATIASCDEPQCPWPGHAVVSSCATAFVIAEEGLCVSNHHVFDDAKDGTFKVVCTSRGVIYPVQEIVAADRSDDVALFRIDTRGDRFEPIPLRVEAPVGTPIFVLSHPERRFYTMTSGTISRLSVRRGDLAGGHRSRRSPPKSTPPDLPLDPPNPDRLTHAMEVTAEYALGSSGGPVLDERGNAVGMACATHTLYAQPAAKQDPQAVVRTCVPAESIARLMRVPDHDQHDRD